MPTPFEQELADDGRVQSALSWLRQSGFTTRVADERLLVCGADGTVCAYCYTSDEVVAFARRQSPARGAGLAPAAPPPGARVRDLEETIRYLRERWHLAIAERDEWEQRARAAQAELDGLRAASGAPAKYAALRRFIARELHPDATPATGPVLAAKSDLFKLVWAEITRLDKS